MNNYKTYLFKESGNHLYRMKDEDTRNMWNNQSLVISSTHIKDFFDFYLQDLKITPKELMENSDSSRFIEIFYNIHYQRFEQRKEWINTFEETIVNNPIFFKEALKTCLTSHSTLLNNSYPDDIKNHYLEENKQLFEQLVKKGKEAGSFNHISQADLSTSYSLYKTILEQEGVFKSDFSFSKLIDSLKPVPNNRRSDENKFFQTYIVDVIEFLKDKPEKMQEILKDNIILKNFVTEILTVNDPANFELQSSFVSDLIKKEQQFRSIINEENKKPFYNNFRDLVPLYFNSLNHTEKQSLFNDHHYGFNNSKISENYGAKATHWLGLFMADDKSSPADFDTFDLVLTKQKEIGKKIEIEDMNEFCSRAQVAFIAKHIEYDTLQVQRGVGTKENEIIDYLHERLRDTSFTINPKNQYASDDIGNLEKVYKFIIEKDGESLSLIKDKINLNAERLIKELFAGDTYNKTKYVDLLAQTLNRFECPESLKVITEKGYAWDLEVNKKISGKKTTYIPQPFVFTLIEATSPQTFEWFLNSPQLEELANIKYKNKNIVEHLSTQPKFDNYLNILAENPLGFKKLVLENKKTLRKLSNSENENVKKTTVFIKMEDKLPAKEVKSKPLKI
jgi:hypothetical protein